AGVIGPGIDTRGDGGYVLAPPSVHPSGAIYRWTVTVEPIEAPDWLIERARKKPRTNSQLPILLTQFTPPLRVRRGYRRTALAYECDALAAAPGGTRNAALIRAAFCLFQLVAGGEITEEEVVAGLISACERNGLLQDDGAQRCHATIKSAAKAGI